MSYSWFQTSQTGGQQYSDTSPFSIPCLILYLRILLDGLVEEIAVDPSVNVMTFFITDSHDK